VKLPSDIEAHDEVERFDVVRVQGTAQDGRLLKLHTWPAPEPSPAPPENSVVSLACRFACEAGAVMVG
jgi:hypothetical protein